MVVASFVIATAPSGARAGDSLVLAWNAALLDAIRAETTPPPLAARNLAIVHLALREACTGGEGRPAVHAAISGCVVASSLYPGYRSRFEALRDRALSEISPAVSPAEWTAAVMAASACLESRNADGACRSVTYIPQATPGQWRRTPPFFRPPELPQWRDVRPFALGQPGTFAPPGPPALESGAWIQALEESAKLGGRESGTRTEEQALLARFWSDFSYTNTPPGHWNDIAAHVARARGFDEATNARLFAVLNVAMADAGIVCWQAKYRHNFWRPVTALASQCWVPLLNTPAHPEYPSGHSVFSAAAAAVLAEFMGTDECEFVVRSDSAPGVERRFRRFSEAAREISDSRVFGGIHFRFSCEDGLKLGHAVAEEVLRRERQPGWGAHGVEVAAR